MNTHGSSSRPYLFVTATLVAFCLAAGLARAEVKPQAPGSSAANNPNPFNIYSICPPANCRAEWNGMGGAASGQTDFTPAGLPIQFSFNTEEAVTWSCDQFGNCQATYGSGGPFSMTGPAGTFSGIVTSGSAAQYSNGTWQISVNFSGQWSNGQHMTGTAADGSFEEDIYSQLNMHPAH